jgi:cytochrome c biogenesis factor
MKPFEGMPLTAELHSEAHHLKAFTTFQQCHAGNQVLNTQAFGEHSRSKLQWAIKITTSWGCYEGKLSLYL